MPHPLSPLTAAELQQAVVPALASRPGARIVHAGLREPEKSAYLAWRDGDEPAPARQALVVVRPAEGGIEEVVVALDAGTATDGGATVSRTPVPGALAPITPGDYAAAETAVREDARVIDALRARGVDDVGLVQVDVLPANDSTGGRRVASAVLYVRRDPGDNAYARPVEHLIVVVDLDTATVVELQAGEDRPLPAADGDYRAGVVPARDDLRPIAITQPEGVSFELSEDGVVRWHRWSLVVGFHPQEGLVLHDVRYDDRAVLHRGACAEMIVPYGSPDPMHDWRAYFDAGEYGLGACANPLALGCDCLGEIRYLDAWLADADGAPYRIPNAICLHEEDSGVLWKHTEHGSGHVELRRGRRFVVNTMSTVGNYEYAFRWYLGLDGTIELEVQLHGIVSTIALGEDGAAPAGANVVDTGLGAPHHQHLFCFRLDLDVDGPANEVLEVDAERIPTGPENPSGNAFRSRVTVLADERDGARDADESASRTWLVRSTSARNALGGPTAYRLVPGHGTATLLAQPGSSLDRRAGFARHTLWVTPEDPAERHPGGSYPYGRDDAAGLPQWRRDRALAGEDVVLWYTAGVTHFVRPEDWPIMPVTSTGFTLQPVGFFDRNPTLDLPPSAPAAAGTCRHGE